jgi:hypothetical protein
MPVISDNSGNVFIQFFLPFRVDKRYSVLNTKDSLNVNLGVSIGQFPDQLICYTKIKENSNIYKTLVVLAWKYILYLKAQLFDRIPSFYKH